VAKRATRESRSNPAGRDIVGATLPMAEVAAVLRSGACRDARCPQRRRNGNPGRRDPRGIVRGSFFAARPQVRGRRHQGRVAQFRRRWPGYRIKKFRYEAIPGLWIPALLYEPEKLAGRCLSILNVTDMSRPPRKAYCPSNSLHQSRQARMLSVNVEWVGMGQLGTDGFLPRPHEPDRPLRHQRALPCITLP